VRTISFTTDYGGSDAFVAACHGVALTIAPDVRIVDVTHVVPPGDVRRGAYVLADAAPYLPDGTVHVAVVDPGVGSERRAIVLETPRGLLVGPDNGLLLPAAEALGGVSRVFEATNSEFFGSVTSHTFHGRDLFMPVAAHLAAGAPVAQVGPLISEVYHLPGLVLHRGEGWLEAQIRTVDRFGSLQLAATADDLDAVAPLGAPIRIALPDGGELDAVRGRTFGVVAEGEPVVLVDSTGRAAIAINSGSATERLGLTAGAVVRLSPAGPSAG
jgi:S-adenosylmethionine hydrolase